MSYFSSNAQPASDLETAALFDAIREHWRIEVMHHRRDVTAPAARLIRRGFTDEGAGDKSVDEWLTNTGYEFVTGVKA